MSRTTSWRGEREFLCTAHNCHTYRTFFRQAIITITLTNCGHRAFPGYEGFIVVQRRITKSVANYTISDATGVKTKRKMELDKILTHFNIELDNPVCWLTQDRSRYFLQEMKPEKLYEVGV